MPFPWFSLKGLAQLRNLGSEAAELICGNNQAYSFLPDIAGKSGPFISCVPGLYWYLKKGNAIMSPALTLRSPPARSMHMFVESQPAMLEILTDNASQ